MLLHLILSVLRSPIYTETTVSLHIYFKCMTSDYTKKIAGSLKAWEVRCGTRHLINQRPQCFYGALPTRRPVAPAFFTMSEAEEGSVTLWKIHGKSTTQMCLCFCVLCSAAVEGQCPPASHPTALALWSSRREHCRSGLGCVGREPPWPNARGRGAHCQYGWCDDRDHILESFILLV